MEQKIQNISKNTFKKRIIDSRTIYLKNKIEIKKEYKTNLSRANTKQEKFVAKKNYKRNFRINRNRYALIYNSIKNEELYRKGALETKIFNLKHQYKKKKQSYVLFNETKEKEKLKKEIRIIKDKYSMPVSRSYRKSRTTKVDNQSFINVPFDTPFIRNVKSIILIVFAAFLATLAMDIFVKPFGIYSAGLRGITQTIFYSIQYYHPDLPQYYSHLLFIGINIPLAMFGYLAVGKKFTFFTIFFLFVQYFFSMIIFDFSGLDNLVKPFGKTNNEIKDTYVLQKNIIDNYSLPVISSLIGSIIYGISVGLLYKAGGSTGGSKFIVTWFSVKKGISIGKIAIMLSLFVVSQGILINRVIIGNNNLLTSYTSVTLFATLIFAFSSNSVLDMVFAKTKKEIISVVTERKDEIMRFLDVKFMYNRTFSVEKVKTNFHKKQKYKMQFLVSKTESNVLMNVFTQLDQFALVTTSPVSKAYGKIYSRWFE